MKELKIKKQKSLDAALDMDANILSGISLLISIGVLIGILMITEQAGAVMWLSIIAGFIAAIICLFGMNAIVTYLKVQAEILRTLKRIESKNEQQV